MTKSKDQDSVEVPRDLLLRLYTNTVLLKLGLDPDSKCHQTHQDEINQVDDLLNPPPEIEEEDPRQMSLPGVE